MSSAIVATSHSAIPTSPLNLAFVPPMVRVQTISRWYISATVGIERVAIRHSVGVVSLLADVVYEGAVRSPAAAGFVKGDRTVVRSRVSAIGEAAALGFAAGVGAVARSAGWFGPGPSPACTLTVVTVPAARHIAGACGWRARWSSPSEARESCAQPAKAPCCARPV